MSGEILRVIENSHLFSGLDRKLIGRIAATATIKSLSENELLFQKGDPADALWGVLSGRVVIQMRSDDGKEMVLEAFEAGDVFGEVGVLDFGPRHVTATAEIPSKLFRLERKHFLEHLQSSPELCFRVFSLLCSQLRNTTETLEDTALYKLPKRLAKKLTSLSNANGNYGDDGQPVLHLMQADLAKMLGVNREAVNRHLREWEKRGWVSLKHQQIEIHECKSLTDLAAPSQVADQRNWGYDGIGLLPPAAFPAKVGPASEMATGDRRTVSILAMDAAKYSSLLMADTAGTLRRLREGLATVDKSISRYGGQLIWHAGDRVLAEFSDASAAMQAALAIQASDKGIGTDEPDDLFRIGIHVGELVVSGNHYLGEAINVAIDLTTLATTGGIMVSGQARDALGDSANLDLPFLGNHGFKNVSGEVSVYSARAVPMLRSLYLRLDARIPRRMRPLYLGAALVLVVSIAWMAADRIGRALFPSPVPINSIAVLPFEALGEEERAYLADGITTDIRAGLSSVPGFHVTGAESSAYFKDREMTAREIGKALNVAYLLIGKAGSARGEVHVEARLVDVETGKEVWQATYDRPFEDLMDVERDILHGARATINGGSIDGQELAVAVVLSEDAAARALYMRARHLAKDGMQDSSLKAINLAQQAVALDPDFAEAYAFLAKAYLSLSPADFRWEKTPEETRALAEEALERAKSIRPNSPMVLAAGSRLARKSGDLHSARQLAEQALVLNPNDPDALMGLYLDYYDRDDRRSVENTLRKLLKVEPLAKRWIMVMGSFLISTGRYDEARVVTQRGLGYFPNFAPFHAKISTIALNEGKLVDALRTNAKGRPYGQNLRLWFGLDGGNLDTIRPRVRALGGYVYRGNLDVARRILDETYASSRDSLEFLVLDGHLESLMGNYAAAIRSFDAARMKLADGEEGQLIAGRTYTKWLSFDSQTFPAVALLHAYRKLGRDAEGDEIAALIEKTLGELRRRATDRGAPGDDFYLYAKAQFHAIDGRSDEALETLRRWKDRNPVIFTYIKWDPYFEPLHGELRFQQIVAEIEAELANVRMEYLASLGDEPS